MIAFTDVQYGSDFATSACVIASSWSAPEPVDQWAIRVSPIAEYEPGAFYKRELPCLLAALEKAPRLECIVVDGYVWLDSSFTKGLGAHLFDALSGQVPVVGIAKTAYQGSPMATALRRGLSVKPLYVTSIGLEPDVAIARVRELHGAWRIPTLLKAVDALARGRA